jgi:hypothetical protein
MFITSLPRSILCRMILSLASVLIKFAWEKIIGESIGEGVITTIQTHEKPSKIHQTQWKTTGSQLNQLIYKCRFCQTFARIFFMTLRIPVNSMDFSCFLIFASKHFTFFIAEDLHFQVSLKFFNRS